MDDLDVFAGLGTRGTGKANPMRPDRRSVNDPLGFDYDSMFRSAEKNSFESNGFNKKSTVDSSSGGGDDFPVYDKPVYDDDIFEGLPGVKISNANVASSKETKFEKDVLGNATGKSGTEFDDLLGNIGKNVKTANGKGATSGKGFDDLLPGLGSGSSGGNFSRPISDSRWGSVPTAGSKQQPVLDDPFMVLESNSASGLAFGGTDPQDNIGKYSISKSAKVEASSGSAAVFDDLDPFNSIGKSRNAFSPQRKTIMNDGSPPRSTTSQFASTREPKGNSSRHSESNISDTVHVNVFQEPPLFGIPNVSTEFRKSFSQKATTPSHHETGAQVKTPTSGSANPFDDIWLTVSEIPLFTQVSSAPPPSRPPPPVPRKSSRLETNDYSSSSWKKSDGLQYQSSKMGRPEAKAPPASEFDELEEFAMGRSHKSYDGDANVHSSMDGDAFSAAAASAAAMKDAMDKAEAKFRHAKELREREYAKAARSKESVLLEKDDETQQDKELRETQERLERERKQKEEEEREQRRLEREKEIRLREIERDRARQAVERATREARERASADARLRAERLAVEKVNAEARERAERTAVQRAQAEARERAAAEARERAVEKAAAEAKEKQMQDKADAAKADAEARRRAERAVFERVAAEARGRAASEARERAAAATKMNQQTKDDDLESFFNMGRASSAPRARTSTTDPLFNSQFQNKGGSDAAKAPSSTGTSSNTRKASSTTNFVDDLSSIFGAAPTGELQEVDGESDERRRARLERHQRTQERAAKALAEKNQRDLQAQREQEERHRISETLDSEIKRWAAGKEGNLRALLSTLQYVLWPECGWQVVSLTDLITGASVKKVYRKATLCIHPDKVQQKGATLQQKYIAEKVFDLLKEAWNKFNSEELF